ncbi:short-chain Z-isoprenyl diphosphate synthase [Isoptericola sp. CG 20/1183]|uniref:Isoprenyl transferase n=1 Tax=Isoptericola halotolerans TaxID=300560 RepID=A0ABX5EG81_9MICO|nr:MULTISPECIES: isoprenyl transferase [Isoptericola]MCK0118760.1 isoprenyl transferase [Isoptericola sp. S6320L]PRZ06487.1 short-chain Z-isoprenyl diphosphate synthase [Isoptericola halotolerans]PRZ06707.1 short-chain Z-isoprenyl diphosphate synthase [Isoptericola sp. CG 20/1183]
MRLPHPLYSLYERRLAGSLDREQMPRHVGVILDGNRRWAKSFGETAATGHRRGADKITEFLGWAEELGIEVVTLWMLSTDNLARPKGELANLLDIIEDAVRDLAGSGRWRLRVMGRLDLLPERLASALRAAATETADVVGLHVNVAVGYGGRHEIADAVRSYLRAEEANGTTLAELAERLDVEDIAAHLYTKGQPDPELVIRTSGELRVGGFLMWQSAHSELSFVEAYWPDFRRVDFLRALRDFSRRERRLGR